MRRLFCLTLVAAVVVVPADGKPKRRPAPVIAKAKVPPLVKPDTAIPDGGVMVPRAVMMRPMTPDEADANAVWNLRAGLNVAALQCQFSPYLATVRTYNDLLKHHSVELAAAQVTMQAHFRRYDGAKGLNTFDQYVTKTYNSYSTLDAQYSFCDAAGLVGRGALAVAKGDFGRFARQQVLLLRASLTPVPLSATLRAIDLPPVPLPIFNE